MIRSKVVRGRGKKEDEGGRGKRKKGGGKGKGRGGEMEGGEGRKIHCL